MEGFHPLVTEMAPTDVKPLKLAGRRIHFCGIGGCGMSGLARIVRAEGARCSGSDMTGSDVTESLQREGIAVAVRQAADTLPSDADMMVVSAAITSQHPEVIEAKRRGVEVIKYAQMLGRLMLGRTGVAIAGTHGKSTTTAMLAHVLIQAGIDPTFIVGATCEQIGGGARVGRKDLLIAEACEYDRSFHNFHPTHAVVLNVEEDHLDIYGNLEAVVEAFAEFARRVPADGSLLIEHDCPHLEAVTSGVAGLIETIGPNRQADWFVEVRQPNGLPQVTIHHLGRPVCRFTCPLPGEHMAYNASVAAVTAHRLGASWIDIAAAIEQFRGLDRRMQPLGEVEGVTVVDDYGHHPTEIDKTLTALRNRYHPEQHGGRLICVFQPHQHSRTRFLMERFAESFSKADVVIVPQIYFVRDSEEDRVAVRADDLVYKLQQRGVLALHIDDFEDIAAFLKKQCRRGDLLVVMGAGPVWKVARSFMKRG